MSDLSEADEAMIEQLADRIFKVMVATTPDGSGVVEFDPNIIMNAWASAGAKAFALLLPNLNERAEAIEGLVDQISEGAQWWIDRGVPKALADQ